MDTSQARNRGHTHHGGHNLLQFGWYHGRLDRTATLTLLGKAQVGTFLVRDSSSIPGDYVISVSDDSVKGGCTHYIVNSVNGRYFAGEVYFPSLPAVIEHYQQNTLGRCALGSHVPANRAIPPPVPVPRQDSLEHIEGANSSPKSTDSGSLPGSIGVLSSSFPDSGPSSMPSIDEGGIVGHQRIPFAPEDPAQAIAVFSRTVNAYDPTALVFEIGDRILVREQKPSGTWVGECNGLIGHFPFTAVQLCRQ